MSDGALRFIESECENCGSDLTMVLTSSGTRFLRDLDPIKCRDCGHAGTISVVDGEVFCAWGEIDHDQP